MPGINVTIGGKTDGFVAAMNTVEKVALKSGSVTSQSLRGAEAAIVAATEATKLNVQQSFIYEAALQKVRSELKLVEAAEKAAGDAATERVRKALVATQQGSRALHDEAAIQKTIEREKYQQFWMQNTSANPTTNQKIADYYTRKKANGGVNVYAPTGFGKLIETEKKIASGEFYEAGKTAMDSIAAGHIPESWAKAGEKAGGKFGKGMFSALSGSSSGMSQIISVFSNTLSSVGSGMSPFKVFMQQAPNLAQAFTLISSSARSFIAGLIPIGAIGAVLGIGTQAILSFKDKVVETFYDLEARRLDYFRKSARSALLLQREIDAEEAEKLKSAIEANEALMSAEDELGKQRQKNRYDQEKDSSKRHKMIISDLKDELWLAKERFATAQRISNSLYATPAQRTDTAMLGLKVSQIEGRIIHENNSFEKTSGKTTTQPLTSHEQVGAYSGGGIAVTILDVNRQQLASLRKIERHVQKQTETTSGDGVAFQ